MDRSGDDGGESPRIDVKTLPDSVARLWETMLRLDPSWDLARWLDDRAGEELELVEAHLGRERMRLEQRLHRIETLVKRLKRQREVSGQGLMNDPLQKNLFDVFDGPVVPTDETDEAFEANEPVVAGGILGVEDDPLLAIVAEHILGTIEVASLQEASPVHFDELIGLLRPMGISVDEIDEALAHLLQHRFIIELEQDLFGLNS
ncbi:MAG: hypothetical protein P8Q45_04220 [Candidatus Thalassarchaeaceae archaeon]|nr:hypothetical protein [Candidatus Thalassarchaeaceae archaeon]